MNPDRPGLVSLDRLKLETWEAGARELLEAVLDVARRLDHNVVSPEHLMVVGAEHGVQEMSEEVASLAAFREALLDGLFEQRAEFRRWDPEGAGRIFLDPELVEIFRQARDGAGMRGLMVSTLLGPRPLIQHAREGLRRTHSGRPAAQAKPAPEEDALAGLLVDLSAAAAAEPPLIGHEGLVDEVVRSLLRLGRPVVLLVGPAGAGKTAFVRGLAGAAARGEIAALAGFRFHQLQLAELVSLGHRGADLHQVVEHLLTRVASDPHGVLVVDDVHLLVGKQGTAMLSDVLDTLRMRLQRPGLRALLTVESEMYLRAFASDSFFTSEVTVKALSQLERDELLEVVQQISGPLEQHFGVQVGRDALEAAVAAGMAEDGEEYAAPGLCVRLLDEACTLARTRGEPVVSAEHVASSGDEGAHRWDRQRLAGLEGVLNERVLGQPAAVAAVARRVRLAKQKLDRNPERPDGVFLFVGPSGVGKVALARALAHALYDDATRLVRLDMGEASEPYASARMVGLPVAQPEGVSEGTLTGPIARMGHGVVLLDKIEKAHPQVLDLLGQVFEQGRLSDASGHETSFSDTVIIMTSNIGRTLYSVHGPSTIGFDRPDDGGGDRPLQDAVLQQLLRALPSEFVNRIDEIVPFRLLGDADVRRIASHLLQLEAKRWKHRGKTMTYTDSVADLIAKSGYDARLGARHVERNLEHFVIALLGDAAITDQFEGVRRVHLDARDGRICLELDGKPFECLEGDGGA